MANDKNLPMQVPQTIAPYKEQGKTLIGRGLTRVRVEEHYKIGMTHDHYGLTNKPSIKLACANYLIAAENGHIQAQSRLGCIYEKAFVFGLDISQDVSERISIFWTEKAAISGDSSAQNMLAHRYAEGRGVSQSYEQAAYWFEKSILNCARDPFSKTNSEISLACMYLRGLGVEPSVAKAVELLESAAANESRHSHHAEHILGDLYLVAERYEDAFFWYKKSVQRKHPLSLCRLGLLYEGGMGVAISYKDAFDCYQKAADQKHPNATTRLGLLYERGLGVQQNYRMAFDLYQIAAELGCSEAYLSLAAMYKDGLYVAKSDEMASAWFMTMKKDAETCEKKIREYERPYTYCYYE